ncbi:MAG: DUF4815 domain-containing protein, partial [Rhodocyclaceae bacterium]|nr:DUF4815 domain-containing protein [Rhodocyclaceae bacterium]
DALIMDGDVVPGGEIVVATHGACHCASARIYLSGGGRHVPERSMAIPLTGHVSIGVRLTSQIITELEDPSLRDPAVGVRNYQEPGAGRKQETCAWGWVSANGNDGGTGEFYAISSVVDGVLQNRTRPPAFDGVTQLLARYDFDANGHYIVGGLDARFLERRSVDGKLALMVSAGSANVGGFKVERGADQRIVLDWNPDLSRVVAEPHVFAPNAQGNMRITLNRPPQESILRVQGTLRKTVTVTHGVFTGATDTLPDTAVVQVLEVKQGTTVYQAGPDFTVQGNAINWSPVGAEPAAGSTYTVTYDHIGQITPTLIDETGMTVADCVSGTLVQIDYDWRMPRTDALALGRDGQVERIQGVAATANPVSPTVPADKLRDMGLPQSAVCVAGMLMAPLSASALGPWLSGVNTLPTTTRTVLEQTARTGSMKVNPYAATQPAPAAITLTPNADFWREVQTAQAAAVTETFVWGSGALSSSDRGRGRLSRRSAVRRARHPGDRHAADEHPHRCAALGAAAARTCAVWWGWDPLAQTFTLPEAQQVSHAELWFTTPGTRPVTVQIRATTAGMPNRVVLAEGRINAAQIAATGATRIALSAPIWLDAGVEYALVVLTDDLETACAIAELGKWDSAASRWVTSQPYQVGVLLSSSNASTWTAHQDKDMAFRLLGVATTAQTRTLVLASQVQVTNATDFLVLGAAASPVTGTGVTARLTLEDGRVLRAPAGATMSLPARFTGKVDVVLEMTGTAQVTPVVSPGWQMVVGTLANTASYISRAIPAAASFLARVIAEVFVPGTASITASLERTTAGQYQAATLHQAVPVGDGWVEIEWRVTGLAGIGTDRTTRVKFDIDNSPAHRARLRALRVIVT